MFAICVKTGIIFKMRSTLFFHVSVPNIYCTSSSAYLIIFLMVISKVLFFNITQKFTNLLVQLSIFLIDLFVGTYRLSSHARLEAFVIQTKLNYQILDRFNSVAVPKFSRYQCACSKRLVRTFQLVLPTFQLDSIGHIHHPAIQCSLHPCPTSLAI